MKQQKRFYDKKNYFLQLAEDGLKPEIALWEITTRIMEFYEVIDQYLVKLEQNGILTRGLRKEFLQKSFQMLYDDIYLNAVIAIEKLDIGGDWIKEENELIGETKSMLQELEDKISEDLKHTLSPFTFGPIEYVRLGYKGESSSKQKTKKKPGRPRLIAS